ncbi:MAG TPA: LytTR family DNA-binding domain-containing protein [Pyrinomonadaceae bacterium]|jgi:two-component system LytT family response regulator
MPRLRALIVDDEPFARERVRRLLAADEEIEIVGECADGLAAVRAVAEYAPDLLFLDIQMPGKDGFAVLEELGRARAPVVIFLTAYDQYAVRAFEACALDYLLKPFDEERFERALARAKAQLRRADGGEAAEPTAALMEPASSARGPAPLERVVVKTGGRIFFLKTSEVDWIEAYGNYVRLHTGATAYLLREPLSSLEAQVDPRRFLRIHRSALVNVERIREMQPMFHGQYIVILHDGTRLTLSRRYRSKLQKSLGKAF